MERFKFTDAKIREFTLPAEVSRCEIWDDEVKHLCCRVSHTGRKVFQVIGKLHGKTTRVTLGLFPSLGVVEARGKARKALVAMADGINTNENKRTARTDAKKKADSLKSVFDQMLEVKPLSKHTRTNYNSCIKHLEKWHSLPVVSISREMVLSRYHEIKHKVGPYAANRASQVLSAALNHARTMFDRPVNNPVKILSDVGAWCKEAPREKVKLPDRQKRHGYREPDYPFKYIPEVF